MVHKHKQETDRQTDRQTEGKKKESNCLWARLAPSEKGEWKNVYFIKLFTQFPLADSPLFLYEFKMFVQHYNGPTAGELVTAFLKRSGIAATVTYCTSFW